MRPSINAALTRKDNIPIYDNIIDLSRLDPLILLAFAGPRSSCQPCRQVARL
jgi:hypothetical protein